MARPRLRVTNAAQAAPAPSHPDLNTLIPPQKKHILSPFPDTPAPTHPPTPATSLPRPGFIEEVRLHTENEDTVVLHLSSPEHHFDVRDTPTVACVGDKLYRTPYHPGACACPRACMRVGAPAVPLPQGGQAHGVWAPPCPCRCPTAYIIPAESC